jgi:hypothetical protein
MNARTAVARLILASLVATGCSPEAPSTSARRSFELGSAITNQCEPTEGNGYPAAYCEPLNAAVAALRVEHRDEAWAGEMEKHIDEMFRADGRYWAEIRSLECRQTLCAVEYAQDLDAGPTLNEMAFVRLLQWLEPTTGGMGFEMSPASSRHKVISVMVWRKKPPATAG